MKHVGVHLITTIILETLSDILIKQWWMNTLLNNNMILHVINGLLPALDPSMWVMRLLIT